MTPTLQIPVGGDGHASVNPHVQDRHWQDSIIDSLPYDDGTSTCQRKLALHKDDPLGCIDLGRIELYDIEYAMRALAAVFDTEGKQFDGVEQAGFSYLMRLLSSKASRISHLLEISVNQAKKQQ